MSGAFFSIQRGEALEFAFSFREEGTEDYLDLYQNYDLVLKSSLALDEVSFGSFSTRPAQAGAPSDILFLLSASQSDTLSPGLYTLEVDLAEKVNPEKVWEGISIGVEISDAQWKRIPVNPTTVTRMLHLASNHNDALVARVTEMARMRMLQWLSPEVSHVARRQGWPKEVVHYTTELASLFLAEVEYDTPGAAQAYNRGKEDIRRAVMGLNLDLDGNGENEIRGTGGLLRIRRGYHMGNSSPRIG